MGRKDSSALSRGKGASKSMLARSEGMAIQKVSFILTDLQFYMLGMLLLEMQ